MSFAVHQHKDQNGAVWNYINEKELQDLYPNGGFKIFSDLDEKGVTDSKNLLVAEGSQAGLCPYKKKLSWLKTVIGYVLVVDEECEEGYIRIIGRAWYKLLFIMFAALVCATVFVAGIWFARQDEAPGLDKTAVSYHIDGVKNTDSESILLPGLGVLKAKEGDTHVKEALVNPDGNGCYFTYIIKLADTDEILYCSGLISPGKAVIEFDINRTFKAGRYPIKVIIETRDIKDQSIEYNAGNIDAHLEVTK